MTLPRLVLSLQKSSADVLLSYSGHTRLWSATIIPRNLGFGFILWPCCLTHTYFIMTHYYTVWSFSTSLASGFRSTAFLHIICYGGPEMQSSFYFGAAPNIALSLELLVFLCTAPTTPQVLSMGHSWSKHRVLHIILRQFPAADATCVQTFWFTSLEGA